MGGNSDSRGGGRRIDDLAKGRFLEAVRHGAALRDAALAAGFTAGAFWKERRGDPALAEALEEAIEHAAAHGIAAPTNRRRLQRRGHAGLRFVVWRREIFLAYFAATCNETASAAAAGVAASTVYRHRRKDAVFAAEHQAALEQGYVRLEAAAVREREAAQRRMEAAIAAGRDAPEAAVEFDRVMKLLDRYERRAAARAAPSVGPRRNAPEHRRTLSLDQAVEALERKLAALGIPVPAPPPRADDDDEVA